METRILILLVASGTLVLAVLYFLSVIVAQRRAARAGVAAPPQPTASPMPPAAPDASAVPGGRHASHAPKAPKPPKVPKASRASTGKSGGKGAPILLPPLDRAFPAAPVTQPLVTGEWAPADEPEAAVVFDASLGEIAPGTVHGEEPVAPVAVFVPPDDASEAWTATRFETDALGDIELRLAEPEEVSTASQEVTPASDVGEGSLAGVAACVEDVGRADVKALSAAPAVAYEPRPVWPPVAEAALEIGAAPPPVPAPPMPEPAATEIAAPVGPEPPLRLEPPLEETPPPLAGPAPAPPSQPAVLPLPEPMPAPPVVPGLLVTQAVPPEPVAVSAPATEPAATPEAPSEPVLEPVAAPPEEPEMVPLLSGEADPHSAAAAASAAAAYFGLSFDSTPAADVAAAPPAPVEAPAEVTPASVDTASASTDDQIAAIMASISSAAWEPPIATDAQAAPEPPEGPAVPTLPEAPAPLEAATPLDAPAPVVPIPVAEPASLAPPEPGPLVDGELPPIPEAFMPPVTGPAPPQPEPAPRPAVTEYRMVAPVELAFSDREQRVGIKPGTPTFLKYQRLAGVLTNDLKKATTGPGA